MKKDGANIVEHTQHIHVTRLYTIYGHCWTILSLICIFFKMHMISNHVLALFSTSVIRAQFYVQNIQNRFFSFGFPHLSTGKDGPRTPNSNLVLEDFFHFKPPVKSPG